jgi:lipopolysaccharide biosynthesis protein
MNNDFSPRKFFIKLFCNLYYSSHLLNNKKSPNQTDKKLKKSSLKENAKITSKIKAIAFYLPQYHPFKENDAWWGKGFTEWTNVGKAKPNFEGHYQPHCPIHLGYYDLRIIDNMIEQSKLAKSFGIHGFCYYYYWFDGKTLMELPLINMLNDKRVDIPFFLMWANENWSRRWDGLENDILIAQKHSKEDSLAFIKNLSKYFLDDRYIKVDGKPVLGVYRPDLIPHMKETAEIWREEAKKMGFAGLYIINSQSFQNKSPEPYDFDAAVQFPPFPFNFKKQNSRLKILNKNFSGPIFKYNDLVHHYIKENSTEIEYKLFKSTCLSWDNTARKQNGSFVFSNFKISEYESWLNNCAINCLNDNKLTPDEKFIFINAWNEWAEGTHLEPDQQYGYQYLQATYDVLKNFNSLNLSNNLAPKKISNTAIIIHAHYKEELIVILNKICESFIDKDYDLYITCTSSELIDVARQYNPKCNAYLVENRGRDILPFIEIYKKLLPLNYSSVCKIHTKRSVYREDGKQLFEKLINPLIGSREIVLNNIQRLSQDESTGMLVPRTHFIQATFKNTIGNFQNINLIESITESKYLYEKFSAGSMFWFKPNALKSLEKINEIFFQIEDGAIDGKFEHGIERMFTSFSNNAGYKSVAIG